MWYFNQLIGYLNQQIVHFLDIFSLVKKRYLRQTPRMHGGIADKGEK
jgi:hypothetical protein